MRKQEDRAQAHDRSIGFFDAIRNSDARRENVEICGDFIRAMLTTFVPLPVATPGGAQTAHFDAIDH